MQQLIDEQKSVRAIAKVVQRRFPNLHALEIIDISFEVWEAVKLAATPVVPIAGNRS